MTGATGFLGRHTGQALALHGHKVLGIARRKVAKEFATNWGFSSIESGPFSTVFLEGLLKNFGPPNVIFHAIGSGSVSQAAADRAGDIERTIGTLRELEGVLAQLGSDVRLIYPSSAAVYGGGQDDHRIREGSHPHPVSIYGENKRAAEQWCLRREQEDGTDVVVLRLFSVFGSPQRKLLFWDIYQQVVRGENPIVLGGTGLETRDFIHATDAAIAIALVAESRNVAQVINVGSGESTSVERAAHTLVSALDTRSSIEFNGLTRVGDPEHQCADISRLRSLGFVPQIDFVTGVREYAQWVQRAVNSADEATPTR